MHLAMESVGTLLFGTCLILGSALGCSAPPAPFAPQPNYSSATAAYRGFDPFPEDRSGPQIDGARPPGFEHPVSEPDRVRHKPWLTSEQY